MAAAVATRFSSSRAHSLPGLVLTELQLCGHRPFQDEAGPRLLPNAEAIGATVADIFGALVATLSDTRLEPRTCSGQPSTSSIAPSA